MQISKEEEIRKLEKELLYIRIRIDKTLNDMRTVRSGSVTCIVNGFASNAMSHWLYLEKRRDKVISRLSELSK